MFIEAARTHRPPQSEGVHHHATLPRPRPTNKFHSAVAAKTTLPVLVSRARVARVAMVLALLRLLPARGAHGAPGGSESAVTSGRALCTTTGTSLGSELSRSTGNAVSDRYLTRFCKIATLFAALTLPRPFRWAVPTRLTCRALIIRCHTRPATVATLRALLAGQQGIGWRICVPI